MSHPNRCTTMMMLSVFKARSNIIRHRIQNRTCHALSKRIQPLSSSSPSLPLLLHLNKSTTSSYYSNCTPNARLPITLPIHHSFSTSFNNNNHGDNKITTSEKITVKNQQPETTIRLSKLIAQMGLNMQMSRKSAEFIITAGQVTIAGKVVTNPSLKLDLNDDKNDLKSIKVAGRLLRFNTAETTTNKNQSTNTLESKSNASSSSSSSSSSSTANNNILLPKTKTRVWIAHKLKGELVSEHDPLGRASLIERLYRGGVGKIKNKSKNGHQKQSTRMHLKPIGRLDMTTEGLILITNDGLYAREMTLPSNAIQRTYRVRVHGRITQQKLNTIRNGIMIDDTFYKGMKVHLELNKSSTRAKGGNTNSWLQVTCTQGKNRMIRKVLDHLGLQVTRLIRTSFGDYDLNTIPPGLAIEVPVKALEKQKRRGLLHFKKKNSGGRKDAKNSATSETQPVEWIRHL